MQKVKKCPYVRTTLMDIHKYLFRYQKKAFSKSVTAAEINNAVSTERTDRMTSSGLGGTL